jgi:hypothetical protein
MVLKQASHSPLPVQQQNLTARTALLTLSNDGCTGTIGVKRGLAQMLKGGVIMDVINAEQARIAEVSSGDGVGVIAHDCSNSMPPCLST